MGPRRVICHVDMDSFFSSIEKRDDPSLKDKPIAVGSTERRGVVASCCYVARSFGVRNAMPSWEAKELCPHIVFVNPDFEKYKEANEQLSDILHRYTEVIEFVSIDEAYLDLSDKEDPLEVCASIRQDVYDEIGVTCTIGVSVNKFLAKVSSGIKKPNSLNVTMENIEDFVENLPIEKFRGVGKKTSQFFQSRGVVKGIDLKNVELTKLTQWFGDKLAVWYHSLARGKDDREVDTTAWVRKSINVNETFSRNIDTDYEAYLELDKLAERLARRIEKSGSFGTTLVVKAKYAKNFKVVSRSITIASPIKDQKQILDLAVRVLKGKPLTSPIRLLGLVLTNLKDTNKLLW